MSTQHSKPATAIVTGASQGLGYALAGGLVAAGWSIVVDARRSERLATAVEELRGARRPGSSVIGIVGDITDPTHRSELVAAARSSGDVRLVINNASTLGTSPLPLLDRIDPDVLRRIYDVNVVGPLALVADLRDHLPAGSVIVNVSSDAAVEAYEGWGGYGSSKAALDHASRVLAAEHPQWRVLAIDPGDMRTDMHQAAFPGEDISDRPEPAIAASAILRLIDGTNPSGRYHADEVPS